jgi:spore maturation protein CgeB
MQSLGYEVVPFDMGRQLRSGARLAQDFGWRFSAGPALRRLNADLISAADTLDQSIDVVWIDKGQWIYPQTLQRLREKTRAVLAHYTPDPAVTFQRLKSRLFLPSIPLYDVIFTTKPFEVETYRREGAKDVRLVHQSYDDSRLVPQTLSEADRRRFGSEVCFIGQYTSHYARLLRAAARSGMQMRVWGPQWRSRLWRNPWARNAFAGDGVWGADYGRALSAADIALCLLSKRYPETTTTRTFEIPACGTFMLAERTDAHQELYEEGREAEFFGTEDELIDKLRFYRTNEVARRRIAAAGHARCVRDGYGNRARMSRMLASLKIPSAVPFAQEA